MKVPVIQGIARFIHYLALGTNGKEEKLSLKLLYEEKIFVSCTINPGICLSLRHVNLHKL